MSSDLVRFVAAVLVVILTTNCGSSLEERRPEESIASAQGLGEPRVVFIPAKLRAQPVPSVDQAQLVGFLREVLPEVRLKDLDAEWDQIVSDPRFRSLRAEKTKGQYRIVLASWSAGDSRLEAITTGYKQWCGFKDRRSRCISIPPGQRVLTDAEVYTIAFDSAMGAQWDGFIRELKGAISPATLRIVLLTGLVVFMACLAMPELTSKIPVAIATAVLTAYLGAQAVCDLVFGWFRMIREVEAATSFEQVQAAGERYGVLIGAETARVLIVLAMAALSEGGVIARLMKLPKIAEASAALAVDSEGAVKSLTQVSGAKIVQGEGGIAADGVAQGAMGVAMAVRGEAPKVRTAPSHEPPRSSIDNKQHSGTSTLQPGPHAKESIPARGPERDFTFEERNAINRIGREHGCHTCGTRDPGTKSGDFIPDHQPPSKLAPGEPQRLYPHCKGCSQRQGGEVNSELHQGG